jgi:hypothetical protein
MLDRVLTGGRVMKSHEQKVLVQAPPRGLDRRGFLRRAGAVAAGGLGAAALERSTEASAGATRMDVTPTVPVPAGARPGEPYFFRIDTMGGRTPIGPGRKEV